MEPMRKKFNHVCVQLAKILPFLIAGILIAVLLFSFGIVDDAHALASTLYVDDTSGTDDSNCQTPSDPCKTINYAIGQASIGDSLQIAGGTYTENVIVNQEVSLVGGYEATGWTRDLSTNTTIIDANNSGRPVTVNDDKQNVVLDGLEIVGGNTTVDGGGIYITGGDVQILNSVIGENTTTACCGGIHIGNSATVLISNTEISFNYSEGPGGGLGIYFGTDVTIEDSDISYNESNTSGGAIDIGFAGAQVSNTIMEYNEATEHGGALSTFQSIANFTNTLFTNNLSKSGNANVIAINTNSEINVLNSTIAENNPTGAQAVLLWGGTMTITNSIMWSNALSLQSDPPCSDCFVINYSDIQGIDGLAGVSEGVGNFDADPLFTDQELGNYHIKPSSPCIDKGTSDGAPGTDIEGNPRTPPPDVGAYEWIGVKVFLPMVVKH